MLILENMDYIEKYMKNIHNPPNQCLFIDNLQGSCFQFFVHVYYI